MTALKAAFGWTKHKVRTAREIASHSTGSRNGPMHPGLKDVFTFVRIIRDRDPDGSYSSGAGPPIFLTAI